VELRQAGYWHRRGKNSTREIAVEKLAAVGGITPRE